MSKRFWRWIWISGQLRREIIPSLNYTFLAKMAGAFVAMGIPIGGAIGMTIGTLFELIYRKFPQFFYLKILFSMTPSIWLYSRPKSKSEEELEILRRIFAIGLQSGIAISSFAFYLFSSYNKNNEQIEI